MGHDVPQDMVMRVTVEIKGFVQRTDLNLFFNKLREATGQFHRETTIDEPQIVKKVVEKKDTQA